MNFFFTYRIYTFCIILYTVLGYETLKNVLIYHSCLFVFMLPLLCDSDMVIDSMVATGQLKEDLSNKVREAMLKKHHHQNERKLSNRFPLVRSIADIGKKHSDPLLLERNGEILQRTHISCSSICSKYWGTVLKSPILFKS